MATVGITTGGVWWPPEVYQAMESLGFDTIWTGEHILYHRPILDAVPMLSALSASTREIRIGSAVMLFPLRHPTLVAKELATIDVISDGRLTVGVGAGGDYATELEASGVGEKPGRRLSEMIEIVRKYWQEDYVTYHGEFFDLVEAGLLEPKPRQTGGPPIVVGGRSNAAIKRAGRLGDGYMPYMYHPARYRQAVEEVRLAAEAAGRVLGEDYIWSLNLYVSMDHDRERARKLAEADLSWRYGKPFGPWIEKYVVYGTPDECRKGLLEYVEAGVRDFAIGAIHSHSIARQAVAQGDEAGAVMDTVELYARELLPALQER